ncbi:unnamed protein product [Medioppia subpectinata]|uniref:Uncharacterized protein n=1 Tax=Medioppia subpectinata TaxID=1979941 RepID=A0A7R9LQ61_9ACAR|nr:unnamed protein product [Medioppia subpectinata]CAG2120753.1 unnamed protein product [Medioppia subpectinata]
MIKRYVLTPIVKSTLRYKAIVLGDRGVGKSCLIERLCGHPFPKSATSGHQMGAQYSSTVVKINQRSVIMEFWDTSGQSEEESVIQLMPMCYRSAHTVILVYDIQCRQSFDNLSKYLSLLDNTCAEEMPFVVLLGNKRDDKSAAAVEATEAAEFVDSNPAIGVFEEMSAKCDTHFNKLLAKICRNLIITFPNIPLHQNIRIKNRHHKQKTKLKNWFKCGAKYIQD